MLGLDRCAQGRAAWRRYRARRARDIDGKPARVKRHALARRCRDLGVPDIALLAATRFAAPSAIVERLASVARGVRIVVSGGFEMALVASGRLDAFVSIKADVVSHAAGMHLVVAGGGRVTTLDGRDSSVDDLQKIATNGFIHDELLAGSRVAMRTGRCSDRRTHRAAYGENGALCSRSPRSRRVPQRWMQPVGIIGPG